MLYRKFNHSRSFRSGNQEKAGCILINRDRKLLVVHNIESDYWGFPKGAREYSETSLTAATRELFEETGISLDESLITTALNAKRGCLFVASGDFAPECSVDGKEIDKYDWVELNELKRKKTSKFTQAFFHKIENTMKALML